MCVGYTLFRIRDLSICGSLVSLGKSGNQSPWVLRDDGKHINVVGNQILLWNGETQRLREREEHGYVGLESALAVYIGRAQKW